MESGRNQTGVAGASPCAACKLLRRRCSEDCVFAPYFPADEPHKFVSVHKVFGASNVNKMLQELAEHQRADAVSAMVYEANARGRDPVYGCVGAISSLQQQVDILQSQLALTQAQLVQLRTSQSSDYNNHNNHIINNNYTSPEPPHHHHQNPSPSTTLTPSSTQYFNTDTTMMMMEDEGNIEADSLWSY